MATPVPLEQLSVLIVTHDRAELLGKLLESLERTGGDRWASVVVIDDSVQPLRTEGRFPRLPLRHRVLPERVYISRAKNLGLREIDSPFVLIIDDDNTLSDSTLARPLQALAEDPRRGAVMPAVLYRAAPDLVWVYATPFLPDRWGFDLVGRNRPRAPALEGRRLPTDALPNAAFFRTEALRSVQGYDERYRSNSSADLCQRLKWNGWLVEADTGSFVLHDVEPPGRPGYWAAHTVTDPTRAYHEARDWFRFEFAVHHGESHLGVRALYRAA
ncbi:MAG: glycosyltransferase, partial [Thermoplasmata archaeon]|nr:glycosyltransferase [Thermoplasmata archaeon]